VIALSLGNCSNDAVVVALQAHGQRLNDAFADPAIGLLELIP
jgi:predicted nuclease of predicted toxin-antitoxin system